MAAHLGSFKKQTNKQCPGHSKTIKSRSQGVGRLGNRAFLTPGLFQREAEVVSCGSSLRAFQRPSPASSHGRGEELINQLEVAQWAAIRKPGSLGRWGESVDTEYELPSLFSGALLTSSQGALSQIEGKTKLCFGDTDPGYSNQHGRGLVALCSLPYLARCPTPSPHPGSGNPGLCQLSAPNVAGNRCPLRNSLMKQPTPALQ